MKTFRTLIALLCLFGTAACAALPASAQSEVPPSDTNGLYEEPLPDFFFDQEEGVGEPEPEGLGEEPAPIEAFPADEYSTAEVIEIIDAGTKSFEGFTSTYQILRIRLLSGPERGKEVEIEHAGMIRKLKEGQKVVIAKITVSGESEYYVADEYRLPWLIGILAAFFALVIVFGRLKGLTSIFGLTFTIIVIAGYMVPTLATGGGILRTTLISALAIALISLYLAHGFSKQTTVALGSTVLTLGISVGLAALFVALGRLYGLGSDEAAYLQIGTFDTTALRGLLLGGIIIGTLGVLDDVTMTQTATVAELHEANPSLTTRELYRHGINVGREHITSLVNTLMLAYSGASLPLFLLFTLQRTQPLWVVFNSETIAEELVRTLVGSTALVFAVPISTFFAAWYFGRKTGQAPTLR